MNASNKVFVCRENEVKNALDRLGQAIKGDGSVLFVSGEIGIGKTDLINQIATQALIKHTDLVVLKASCASHFGVSDAYLPFKSIFRQIIDQENKTSDGSKKRKFFSKDTLKILNEFAPDVAALFFPAGKVAAKGVLFFFSRYTSLGKESGPHQLDQEKIFDQCVTALTRISELHPVMIIIDDLHWADNATLSLLFHIARNINRSKLFIIAAYRSAGKDVDEVSKRNLDHTVNEILRYGGNQIKLDWDSHSAAGKRDIAEFVTQYLASRYSGYPFPFSFVTLLAERSGGNPLFIDELLNTLEENGSIRREGENLVLSESLQSLDKIPDRLEAIAEQRIAHLTKELRSILTCASVEGDEFSSEVLAKVKNLNEEQAFDLIVQQLEKGHHLVDEKGEKLLESNKILSLFEFRHKLLREHLYRELSQVEKRRMHSKVGECLEVLYTNRIDEVAPLLARHFDLAKDIQKALHYTILSASNNAKFFAYKDAIQNYRKALELLQSMPNPSKETELKILIEIGALHKISGDYSEASDFLSRALALANSQGAKESAAWTLNNLGDIAKMKGEYQEAEERYNQCSQIAEELHDKDLLIEIANDLAELYHSMDEDLFLEDNIEGTTAWELSFKHASYVSKHASLPHNADNLRRAYNTLGNLYRVHADLQTSVMNYEKSLEISQQFNLKPVALNNLGECHRLHGKLNEAYDYYTRYLAWAKKSGDKVAQAIALNNLALVEAERNQTNAALEYFNKSLDLSLTYGYVHCAVESLLVKGKLLLQDGDERNAQQCFSQALSLNKRESASDTLSTLLFVSGELMISKGEEQIAIWFLEEAIKREPSAQWAATAKQLIEKCIRDQQNE